MKRRLISFALLILFLDALANSIPSGISSELASSALSVPEFVQNNAFVYESGYAPQWLDPHVSYYQYDYWILQQTVETLFWYNGSSSTQVIPWLAEAYKKTSDTQYELKLRQNVKFQDGTPFNATAVWFSLNRLLIIDGTSGAGWHGSQAAWIIQQLLDTSLSSYFSGDQAYDSAWIKAVLDQNFVEIVDTHTVRLNLKSAMSLQFPYLLSGPWASMLSPTSVIAEDFAFHDWGIWDGNYTKYFEHMAGLGYTYFNVPVHGWRIGTGPYYIDSFNPATYSITLKANETYWGGPPDFQYEIGKPRIKEIDFNYVESFSTRLLDLKAGKATGISVSSADLYAIVDRDTWLHNGIFESLIPEVVVLGPFNQLTTSWFNFCTNVTDTFGQLKKFQPMADRRIRLAIASAVNLTEININENNRLGDMANSMIPLGTAPEGAYNPNIKPAWDFNLARSAELLVDAMENPIKSFTNYDGTPISSGVIDNSFGDTNGDGVVDISYTIEMYVGSSDVVDQRLLTTIATNLNALARDVSHGGKATGLMFAVVPVPGGQQYTLASKHLIYMYWGGWVADYNNVMDWLSPMYLSVGTYFSWNRWNITSLDNLYWQAVEADMAGDVAKLLNANDEMNKIANDMVLYFWTWHPESFFVRSSFLKGWYYNTALSVEYFAPMYYSIPAAVDIVPDKLSLKGNGGWVRASIELPVGLNAGDINISSIMLNGTVGAYLEAHERIGDFDKDGVPDLMVRFSKSEVNSYLLETIAVPSEVTLTITGEVSGVLFQGSDTLFVYQR